MWKAMYVQCTFVCDFTGGEEKDVGERADILKFDPSTEAWYRTGEMKFRRSQHTLSAVKWRDYSAYCV